MDKNEYNGFKNYENKVLKIFLNLYQTKEGTELVKKMLKSQLIPEISSVLIENIEKMKKGENIDFKFSKQKMIDNCLDSFSEKKINEEELKVAIESINKSFTYLNIRLEESDKEDEGENND